MCRIAAVLCCLGAGAVLSQAPAAKTGQVTCSGKVLDKEGKPVCDASVTLYESLEVLQFESRKAKLLQEARTRADGAFVFSVAKGADDDRNGYVIIRKDGLAMAWIAWWMTDDRECDVTLGEPRDLAGVVVDEAGRPVADALVRIDFAVLSQAEDDHELLDSAVGVFPDAKTDAEGRFVFSSMPAEATFDFCVSKAGRATVCTCDASPWRDDRAQFSPGQADIRIVLPAEARIQGATVEKSAGRPVAGLKVALQREDPVRSCPIEPAVSAENGSFHFDGLEAGSYTVKLAPPTQGLADWVVQPVDVNLVTGQTTGGITLELVKGAVIEILVEDEESGRPIPDAMAVVDILLPSQMEMRADESGLVRFRVLPGEHSIDSCKDGYTSDAFESRVSIEDGETQRFECALSALPKVTGVVRDLAGKPLAGVRLLIAPLLFGAEEGVTDPNGRFEMTWDPSCANPENPTVSLVAKAVERDLAALIPITAKTRRVDIQLRQGVTLVGKVASQTGKTVSNATVELAQVTPVSGDPFWQTATDGAGSFEIHVLPMALKYHICAYADGYGTLNTSFDGSHVKENRLEIGTINLPPADLSISGIVVDPNGQRVAGAEIHCFGEGLPKRFETDYVFRADSEGRFSIDGLCAGPVRLFVFARQRGNLRSMIETEGGATDLRIVVSKSGKLGEYVPRKPVSLVGQPLPDLKRVGIGLPTDADDRMLLVCLWDLNQRPSRRCIRDLIGRAAALGEKGVTIVAVHAAKAEEGALEKWVEQNKPPFPVGCFTGDVEKTLLDWGTASLPHLILTDRKRTVVAEGFDLSEELDRKVEQASAR